MAEDAVNAEIAALRGEVDRLAQATAELCGALLGVMSDRPAAVSGQIDRAKSLAGEVRRNLAPKH